MKILKRLACSLTALTLALTMSAAMGITAYAQGGSGTSQPSYVTYKNENYYIDEAAVADIVKENMKKRVEEFSVNVRMSADITSRDLSNWRDRVFDLVQQHTGEPDEGDYITYQFGSIGSSSLEITSDGEYYYFPMPFSISYYNTAAQEAQVPAKVDSVLQSLALDGKSDYEKVVAVHDWLRDNTTYDQESLSIMGSVVQYTAYSALIRGKAVCQGYSNAFYRMMLQAGVDCRIVTGKLDSVNHAWNIVKLGDKYYIVDVTNDHDHNRFLKGLNDLEDLELVLDSSFTQGEFAEKFPISQTAYDPNTQTDPDPDPDPDPDKSCAVQFIVTDPQSNRFNLVKLDYGEGYIDLPSPMIMSCDINKDYNFMVAAQGYAPREYPAYTDSSSMSISAQLNKYGDGDGDGKVTVKDAMRAIQFAKQNIKAEGYTKSIFDVNADGAINTKDAMIIIRACKSSNDVKDPIFK